MKREPSFRDYVLSELRVAHIRARMYLKEIETIGVALRGDLVSPEQAIDWLTRTNVVDFFSEEMRSSPAEGETDGTQAGEQQRADNPGRGRDGEEDAGASGSVQQGAAPEAD